MEGARSEIKTQLFTDSTRAEEEERKNERKKEKIRMKQERNETWQSYLSLPGKKNTQQDAAPLYKSNWREPKQTEFTLHCRSSIYSFDRSILLSSLAHFHCATNAA